MTDRCPRKWWRDYTGDKLPAEPSIEKFWRDYQSAALEKWAGHKLSNTPGPGLLTVQEIRRHILLQLSPELQRHDFDHLEFANAPATAAPSKPMAAPADEKPRWLGGSKGAKIETCTLCGSRVVYHGLNGIECDGKGCSNSARGIELQPSFEADDSDWLGGYGYGVPAMPASNGIDAASGSALDWHGKLLKLPRKSAETDVDYRKRLLAELRAQVKKP